MKIRADFLAYAIIIAVAALMTWVVTHAAGVEPTGKFTVSWAPNTEATCADGKTPVAKCPVTGYEIQEQKGDSPIWAIVKGVAPTVTTYTASDIPVGEKRCYRIRVNSNGTFSDPSEEACNTIPTPKYAPRTVQKLTVTAEIVNP